MGIANVIMDNLLSAGKTKPMIVVMPNAYEREIAFLDFVDPRTPPPPPGVGSGGAATRYDSNEKDIVDDLIPFVERNFRTLTGRENRALAGLSMGAITANVSLKRLDAFASIGLLSARVFRGTAGAPRGNSGHRKDRSGPCSHEQEAPPVLLRLRYGGPAHAGSQQT
jgi:enterochelin esterase-like enzyme